MHPSARLRQQPAEGHARVTCHGCPILLLQSSIDVGCRHQACTLFVRLCKAEARFQHFLGRDGTVESTVVLLYLGFFLLVGHIQDGDAEFLVDLEDIPEHLHAQLRILVGKIFIHEKDLRVEYNSPRQRDSLPVRSGEEPDLLVKDIEDYGVVKVTPAGEAYIENPFPIQVIRDHTYNPDDAEYMAGGNSAVEAVDKTLYALLKDLLKDMARNENLPPYVIFQDVSLKDMTIQYPVTIEEMTHITGVGVGKAQKYGRPFVDLIKRYVEENDIERPQDIVVKSVVNKSGLKVYIIQSIDRKVSLDDIALAKNLSMDELLSEVERIVESGTRLNIDYYVEDALDADHRDEIYGYFLEADNDSVQQALVELGENEFDENEIRLVRIQFLSNEGN